MRSAGPDGLAQWTMTRTIESIARSDVVNWLENRLGLTDWRKRHPEIAAERPPLHPVRQPAGAGPPRPRPRPRPGRPTFAGDTRAS